MISPIRLYVNGQHYQIENTKVFSGGELHVNLNHLPDDCVNLGIKCWLDSSDAIMQLLLVANALKHKYRSVFPYVTCGYVPYARQDRVCAAGDAFSMQVMAQVLQVANPIRLYVCDVHSKAALQQLDVFLPNTIICHIQQKDMIKYNRRLTDVVADPDTILVSPDKGAIDKTIALAADFSKEHLVVTGIKKRDPTTGELSGFEVDTNGLSLLGKHCLIVDDICDGGGTFLGLAAELQKLGCTDISLYVTHGIFSKGLKVFDNIIGNVYSTDTVLSARDLRDTEHTQFHLIHF